MSQQATVNTYDIGDFVTISILITVATVATDPTVLALTILEPDGFEIDILQAALTQNATGDWEFNFSPTKAGTHWYRWFGDSPAQGAEETMFEIRESQFT